MCVCGLLGGRVVHASLVLRRPWSPRGLRLFDFTPETKMDAAGWLPDGEREIDPSRCRVALRIVDWNQVFPHWSIEASLAYIKTHSSSFNDVVDDL